MIKAVLLVGGIRYESNENGKRIDDFLRNWEEIELASVRKDNSGVIRSFSNTFEFVKDAYTILENEYLAHYTTASAVLIIGVLNDSWTYNEKFRCVLDFSTYKSDGFTITINAVDDSIENVINSQKSQVFDIPVFELKQDELLFERMRLNNRGTFSINADKILETSMYSFYFDRDRMYFPAVYMEPNFPNKGFILLGDSFGYGYDSSNNSFNYIIKALRDCSVNLKMDFWIQADVSDNQNANDTVLQLYIDNPTTGTHRASEYFNFRGWEPNNIPIKMDEILNLKKDDEVSFVFSQDISNPPFTSYFFYLYNFIDFSVSYIGQDESIYIDAFTPSRLLTSLLSRIGVNLLGEVQGSSLPLPWMLAAESIRGFSDAKVHTSFSKFRDWALSFGYDYEIQDTKIVFKPISSFYDSSKVLELEEVNNIEFTVDQSMFYSGVEVGYDKKDYDEINGRDEFHFTNSFSTGLTANDSIKKLISPYRADCYGIEFLAAKRDEETKDDSSDNDVFIVDAKIYNGELVLRRFTNSGASLMISGVLFPESVFNVAYSPRQMLLANKMLLAACTRSLTFTASNGNSNVTINGINESDPITLPEADRIIRVDKISVDTLGLYPFPDLYKGLIKFEYAGNLYKGFVSRITQYLGKGQTTTYNLLGAGIENVDI